MDEKTRNYYLSHGIVLLNGLLGKSEAVEALARIEFISKKAPGEEIKILINSPGGVAEYAIVIREELAKLQVPVATACAGMADGSAALLLASGTNGKRSALSHSVIHITDIWSSKDGTLTPEKLDNIEKLRARLASIWEECTGQAGQVVRDWMSAEKRFTAEEAVEAGIIDFTISQDDICGGQDGSLFGLFRP